jgi:glycosyltransferase involved in cell wall biosynthesis
MTQFYRSRTSGIFVEALAAGKPVIVTDDTWMSDQLQRYGAGLTFRDQDANGLAGRVRELTANYEHFRAAAERSSRQWAGIHNPERLYDIIQSAREGPLRGLRHD